MDGFARVGLFLAAILAAGGGSLLASRSAQAACAWDINGDWEFYQNNGITASFHINQAGGLLSGTGKYTEAGNGMAFGQVRSGPIAGTIDGRNFSFTADWGGVYEGQIGDAEEMEGKTSSVGWHEFRGKKAQCIAAAAPASSFCQSYADDAVAQATKNLQLKCGFNGPRWTTNRVDHLNWCVSLNGQAQPAATEGSYRIVGLKDCEAKANGPVHTLGRRPAAQQTSSVQTDVDVYDKPGGNGKKTGMLSAGSTVSLAAACQKQDWCNVLGSAVPNGNGWVWGSVRPPN